MTYECKLDAESWSLYASSMDCSPAVIGLNAAMNVTVRNAFGKLIDNHLLSEQKVAQSVFHDMMPYLESYADYGAADSEPQYALCAEIESAFKKHLDVVVTVSRW